MMLYFETKTAGTCAPRVVELACFAQGGSKPAEMSLDLLCEHLKVCCSCRVSCLPVREERSLIRHHCFWLLCWNVSQPPLAFFGHLVPCTFYCFFVLTDTRSYRFRVDPVAVSICYDPTSYNILAGLLYNLMYDIDIDSAFVYCEGDASDAYDNCLTRERWLFDSLGRWFP